MVLQHLNFTGPCDGADVAAQIAGLVERRILTDEQAKAVDGQAIAWFVASEIGQLMRSLPPSEVRRELPVNFPMECEVEGVRSEDALDRVMIRGRIDASILRTKTPRRYWITRRTPSGGRTWRSAESYRPQLDAYRKAIEEIAGIEIDQVYLAFLAPKQMFRLNNKTTSCS